MPRKNSRPAILQHRDAYRTILKTFPADIVAMKECVGKQPSFPREIEDNRSRDRAAHVAPRREGERNLHDRSRYARADSLAGKMTSAGECFRVPRRTIAQNNLSAPQTQRYNLGLFEPPVRENDVGRLDLGKSTYGGFSHFLKVDPDCEPSFSQRISSCSACHSD
jgi:hypothetical protein